MNYAFMQPAPLRAWRERHFASKTCRDVLRTYRRIAAEHPTFARAEIYREVVAARIGADAACVAAALRRAEESFASWPVSRPLRLRDVVHYLAVSGFLATHDDSRWIRANLRRVVDSSIPRDL